MPAEPRLTFGYACLMENFSSAAIMLPSTSISCVKMPLRFKTNAKISPNLASISTRAAHPGRFFVAKSRLRGI